jgi:hypothetical protein
MLLSDKQIWWEAPNAVRIPTGMVLALALGLRIYGVYRSSKDTPKRSPKMMRIERIVAISLLEFHRHRRNFASSFQEVESTCGGAPSAM